MFSLDGFATLIAKIGQMGANVMDVPRLRDPLNRASIMKIERLADHHEATQALWLAIAGVTSIMLIANLILMILY
jgi:hypothetical protein